VTSESPTASARSNANSFFTSSPQPSKQIAILRSANSQQHFNKPFQLQLRHLCASFAAVNSTTVLAIPTLAIEPIAAFPERLLQVQYLALAAHESIRHSAHFAHS
jgi:hypothetical protein